MARLPQLWLCMYKRPKEVGCGIRFEKNTPNEFTADYYPLTGAHRSKGNSSSAHKFENHSGQAGSMNSAPSAIMCPRSDLVGPSAMLDRLGTLAK